MIVANRKFIRVGECWFDEDHHSVKVDLIEFVQRPQPLKGGRFSPFCTMIIDLTQEQEEIFDKIKKDTRYEIRRGETKDGLVFDWIESPNSETLLDFCLFYDSFAATKSMQPMNRDRIGRYAEAGNLKLSRAISSEDFDLVWHAYFCLGNRARLLYSASVYRESSDSGFRSLVGRANRFLHWRDMLKLKEQGIAIYDLGGWYAGNEDEAKLSINRFKEEFGGVIIEEYNGELPISYKGRLYLTLRYLRNMLRSFRS